MRLSERDARGPEDDEQQLFQRGIGARVQPPHVIFLAGFRRVVQGRIMRAKVESQFRSVGLFIALVAVTFNFLQPLVHAAAMRDGPASALWTAFCKSVAAGDTRSDGVPAPIGAGQHECCLGLAHATVVASTPATFVLLAPLEAVTRALEPAERLTSSAIRDGPARPRGPPSIA